MCVKSECGINMDVKNKLFTLKYHITDCMRAKSRYAIRAFEFLIINLMFSFVRHVSATFTPVLKFLCVHVLTELLKKTFYRSGRFT